MIKHHNFKLRQNAWTKISVRSAKLSLWELGQDKSLPPVGSLPLKSSSPESPTWTSAALESHQVHNAVCMSKGYILDLLN